MKLNKTTKTLFIIALIVLAVFLIGGTYSYYGHMYGRGFTTNLLGQNTFMSMGSGVLTPSSVPMPMMDEGGMMGEDIAKTGSVTASPENMMGFEPPYMPSGASAEDRDRIGQKIISTGSITMRVDDAEKRLEDVRKLVSDAGGFTADANITNRANVKTANITARIPVEKYDEVRASIRALASTVFNETMSAEDVTSQFVDLDARLKAAQAEEAQYLDILKQADTVEETLKVTAQLAQVRARIEQMEGSLRYLSDRTGYATLTVTMTEEARVEIPTQEWRPGEVLRQALRDLVVVLQSLINLVIAAAIFIIGLALPIALLVWLVVWAVRHLLDAFRGKRK